MSLAEVFLRIGGALGAWIILAAYGVVVAAVPAVECDAATGEPWRGTLFFAVLAAAALPLTGLGRPWSARLRWAALALTPLLLYDGYIVLPYLEATLSGTPPCIIHGAEATSGALRATIGQRAWAPVQLLVIAGALVQVFRACRGAQPQP